MKQSPLAILVVFALAGCSAQKVDPVASRPNTSADPAENQVITAQALPVAPLPFPVQLAQGDPTELPPVIAASLSNKSPITFTYREELTHDDYHIPLLLTAIDPLTYLGSRQGDFGVTAFAALTIFAGDRVIGDYTAKDRVSRSYTMYSHPTHASLERDARIAVRQDIDAQLQKDASKLAQEARSPESSQARAIER